MRRWEPLGVALCASLLWTVALAQAETSGATQPAGPAPGGAAAPAQPTEDARGRPASAGPAATPQTTPPDAYSYDPAGRRDPFVSLLSRGSDLSGSSQRPTGLRGLLVGEVSLRGIVESQGVYVAILQAPDNRTYIAHPGDRLFDGSLKSISVDTVVFLQDVTDPLSLVKQREIRKPLRAVQEQR